MKAHNNILKHLGIPALLVLSSLFAFANDEVKIQSAYDAWISESSMLQKSGYSGGLITYVFNQSFRDLAALGEPVVPFAAEKIRHYLTETKSGNKAQQPLDLCLVYVIMRIRKLSEADVLGFKPTGVNVEHLAEALLRKLDQEQSERPNSVRT
jgi:hypothetical protein